MEVSMKRLIALLLVVLIVAGLYATNVSAQYATTAHWVSSITYYTPSTEGGTLSVNYFDGATAYTAGPFTLVGKSAGSINIGTTSVPEGFKGSAVLSSTIPVYSTYVQFEKDNPRGFSRSFYSGFSAEQAGTKFFLPTVRSNNITTSTIGIQNVESYTITATINLIPITGTPVVTNVDIAPGASFVSVLDAISGIVKPFDGAAVITAVKQGEPSTSARVVASSQETQDSGLGVYSYEGQKEGAVNVYMASAMCNYVGKQTSYFAIQNVGSASATVEIDYYSAGALEGTTSSQTIAAGGKISVNPCQANLLMGKTGSAVIRSTNGQPLLAIGKVATTDGLITAFTGESVGYTQVVAPYIRWAADNTLDYRSYVAIMNVGSASATNIVANYYDGTGTLRGSQQVASASAPLKPFSKANTTPLAAGALIGDSFGFRADAGVNGGAIEIVSDQPIVVVVRLATTPTGIPGIAIFGEDYNALPVR